MKAVQPGYESAFGSLRQFIRPRKRDAERCELCSAEVVSDHPHLIEPGTRKLLCTCNACAILFSGMGQSTSVCPGAFWPWRISSLRWPVGKPYGAHQHGVLFSQHTRRESGRILSKPAGATESLLPLETWKDIEDANSILLEMESDVEALLVNRVGHARGFTAPEYYVLPIDECYKLVGLIRANWHGLSGGTEVWQQIGGFFDGLKQRATVIKEEANA